MTGYQSKKAAALDKLLDDDDTQVYQQAQPAQVKVEGPLHIVCQCDKCKAQPSQEPVCPECKAGVLYECVACSSNNYPQKPAQEPVAYWNFNSGFSHCMIDQLNGAAKKNPAPLYTAPPQRTWAGLTDAEAMQIWEGIIKYAPGEMRVKDFAQAIEAKLREKNT